MGYFAEYEKLMSPSGFEKLKLLLDEGRILITHSHSDFKINEHDGEKYYSLTINTDDAPVTYAAFLYVAYLGRDDTRDLISSDFDVFPFMMIVTPSTIDHEASNYFSADNTLLHELSHLKCLKRRFDLDPHFIMRGRKFALANLLQTCNASDEEIRECVKYEVEKIFLIEPQAMESDYEHGENVIPIPFLFKVMEYKCDSSQNFVQMKIHQYLNEIKSGARKLRKNGDDHYQIIDEAFDDSLRKFGKAVFGEEADCAYKDFDKSWMDNVLDRVLAEQD